MDHRGLRVLELNARPSNDLGPPCKLQVEASRELRQGGEPLSSGGSVFLLRAHRPGLVSFN